MSFHEEIIVRGTHVNAKANFVMQSENHATVPYSILSIGAPQAQPHGLLDQLRALIHRQFEYDHVSAVDALELALARRQWHVILYDFDTSWSNTPDILRLIQRVYPRTPVIVVAQTARVKDAVDVMRLGAKGFVEQTDSERLSELIVQELEIADRLPLVAETAYDPAREDSQTLREQIKAILDTTQDALLSVTFPDRHLVYVSSAFERVYGYPVEVVLSDPGFFKSIVPPEELDRVLNAMKTCLEDGFVEIEHRVRLPDGQIRWLHRRAWVVYDDAGHPIQVNDSARNITARKQMEEALRQSEGRLRSLFENMQDVVWSADLPSLKINYLNSAVRKVYGRSESEFSDSDLWQKVLHPDDQPRAAELNNSLLQRGFRDAIYRILRPDGEVRWLHDRAWLVRDDAGNPVRIEGIAADITKRKLAEEALLTSEAKQHALFAAIPDSIFYIQSDGTVLDYHGPLDKLILPLEMIIGNNLFDFFNAALVPQSVLQQAVAAVQTVIATRELAVFEYLMPDQHDYEARMIPVGDTNALICIVRDITERKQTERQLQQSEQRLRLFIEYAPAAIAIFDKEMHYVAVSRRWVQDYRLPAESIVGRSHYDVFPEIPERWVQIHQRCLKGAVEKCEADPFPRGDGTVDWVRWEIHPWRDLNGEIGGILLFSEVVTERLQSEQALRQSESYLRSLVDSQTAFNIRVDMLGKITYCNQRYLRQFGWFASEFVGHNSMDMILPIDHIQVFDAVSQCLVNVGLPVQVEVRNHDQNGGHIWTFWEFIAVQDADGVVSEVQCVGFDITKQKQAEFALQEAHDLLEQRVIERTAELERAKDRIEAIFNHSGDGILLLDIAQGIQQANYAFEHLFGIGEGGAHGSRLSAFFDPDDGVKINKVIDEVAATHQTQQIEARAQRMNGGGLVNVEISLAPVNRSEKAVSSLVCIIRDITERKQAQEALRASEERLRILFETSPDAICLVNLQGVFVDVNPAGLALTGRTRAEMIGKAMTEVGLFQKPVYQRQSAEGLALTRQGGGRMTEYEIETAEGATIVIEAVSHPIKLNDELLQLAVIRDITERRRAETALRESEERYRKLISTMSEGIVLQRRDGVIQTFNAAAERILGLSADQLMGRTSVDPTWRAVHEDGSPFPGETHPAMLALTTGEPQSSVIMGVHKPDDSLSWILINSQPIFEPNQSTPYAAVTTFTDITARKHTEAALRESEERYRLLAENVNDVIIKLSPQGGLTFATPSVYALLGYRPEEFVGQSGFDYVHPDDVPVSAVVMQAAIESGSAHFTLVERVLHRDQHYMWVEVTNTNVYDPETGQLLEMVGVLRDITARKQAEEALRESEERYRLLAENVNDVLFRLSADGIVTFITASAYTVLGYYPEELIDQATEVLVHPDDLEPNSSVVLKAFAAGLTHFTLSLRLRHKAGHLVWVEIAATVVLDPHTGAPLEMIGVLRDVTERKLTEDALRTSEEKFRTFVEAAPIATVIANMQGKLELVNQAAAKLFDYDRADLVGRTVDALVPEEYRQAQIGRLSAASGLEEPRSVSFESGGRRRDGSVFPCDIQLSYINTSEGPMVMSHVIDITQRKQADEALKQSLAHEKELGDLKSRFVSMASHEFRTPLAAILAATETLTLYRDRMDQTQIDGRLDRIRQQVTYMKNTIEDVLHLARMQAGRVKFEPYPGDVDALCRDVVSEFDVQMEYQGRLAYTGSRGPLRAAFDERLLRQIVTNLIHNALKYSLKDRQVVVTLSDTDQEFNLRVQDEGIGIPEDDLKHLFEPFHRATNVGTISGTGLGLSITRQSVELHGGTITVNSQLGAGTTFEVTIPKKLARQGNEASE